MSHHELQIRICPTAGGEVTVEMIGEAHFDFDDTEKYIKEVLAKKPKAVKVDASQLTFISSVGMSFLINLRKAVRATGANFELTALQPRVQQVLEHARVLHLFEERDAE